MRVLVDTNILVRSVQKGHPACRSARRALVSLYRNNDQLFLTTQNVAEFWNVCTRPLTTNGLGLTIEATDRYTSQLEKFFIIVPESSQSFLLWRKLVLAHAVAGVKVHDARLLAIMGAHDISHVLTFNSSDFVRFPGITVLHPDALKPTPGVTENEAEPPNGA